MRELALLVMAVAAFAGIVVSGVTTGPHTRDPGKAKVAAEIAQSKRDQAFAAWSAGETVLPRSSNGHFYAQASVNGADVAFLVDTGASMVALTGEDARAAGLTWSSSDVRPVAQGASGPVYGVPVRLDHVSLGGHEADNVDAAIIPQGLDVSLLGQSFLKTIEPVRIEGDRMILGD